MTYVTIPPRPVIDVFSVDGGCSDDLVSISVHLVDEGHPGVSEVDVDYDLNGTGWSRFPMEASSFQVGPVASGPVVIQVRVLVVDSDGQEAFGNASTSTTCA